MGSTFLVAGLLLAFAPAFAVVWEVGDVVVGVSNGRYQVYSRDGVFKETLTTLSGFTTGCAFDKDFNLYTTYFSSSRVLVFGAAHPHGVIQTINPTLNGAGTPESVVFAKDGSFYVGHVGASQDIVKFNAAGVFQQSFNAAVGPVGTDWIDLASDQTTMFHTSEGRQIRRFDLAANAQMTDFAVLAGAGNAYALRLLPPGDGSGGLLVADNLNIKRLNSAGAVVQTYDVSGVDGWFALNLDASGSSFWSGSYASGTFYRFNIASGAVEVGPINTGTGGNTLFGICVLGEITAGVNNPPTFSAPECGTRLNVDPGETLSFTVTAADADVPQQSVTLTSGALPTGATMTPPLPTSGNPVSSVFSWTPTGAFENTVQTVLFTATDDDANSPREAQCRIQIEVGEDLLIVLRSFTASSRGGEVLLEWSTELEIDNAGFYLLRRNVATGHVDRLINTLIPAEGDINQGADYSFVDASAVNGVEYEYVLVDVDLSGIETSHSSGRIVPNPANPPIKLRTPDYGARVDVDNPPSFSWEPFAPGVQFLTLSSDPLFGGDNTLTLEVPRSKLGRNGQMQIKRRDLVKLEQLAVSAYGAPLYWRIVETAAGSAVKVSDTYSLWLDVGSLAGGTPQAGGRRIRVK